MNDNCSDNAAITCEPCAMISIKSQNLAPPRIEDPREVSAYFAICVTVDTRNGHGHIEKHGESSLFRAFQNIMPQVRFNFPLLSNGFIRSLCLIHFTVHAPLALTAPAMCLVFLAPEALPDRRPCNQSAVAGGTGSKDGSPAQNSTRSSSGGAASSAPAPAAAASAGACPFLRALRPTAAGDRVIATDVCLAFHPFSLLPSILSPARSMVGRQLAWWTAGGRRIRSLSWIVRLTGSDRRMGGSANRSTSACASHRRRRTRSDDRSAATARRQEETPTTVFTQPPSPPHPRQHTHRMARRRAPALSSSRRPA